MKTRIEELKERNPENISVLHDMTHHMTDVIAEMQDKLNNVWKSAPFSSTVNREEYVQRSQTVAENNLAFLTALGGSTFLSFTSHIQPQPYTLT